MVKGKAEREGDLAVFGEASAPNPRFSILFKLKSTSFKSLDFRLSSYGGAIVPFSRNLLLSRLQKKGQFK